MMPLAKLLMLVTILATIPAQAEIPKYRVQRLGEFGSTFSAFGLNDRGEVTGSRSGVAYIYRAGSLTEITSPEMGFSTGMDINNRGVVVGTSQLRGETVRSSFLYRDGHITSLGNELGTRQVEAHAINEQGHVVGTADSRGFFFNGSTSHFLELDVFGVVVPNDINDHDAIVGALEGTNEAFLYQDGQLTRLPSLGGGVSAASAINNAGQIVGGSRERNEFQLTPFLYQDGTLMNLGTVGDREGGEALDINEKGWIVGHSSNGGFDNVGFLYRDGQMHDLNDLLHGSFADRARIFSAGKINESGQIIAFGGWLVGPRLLLQPLLLTPVPEPATYGLLLAGLVLIGLKVGRQKQRCRVLNRGISG